MRKEIIPHLAVSLFVIVLMSLGLGYRHLWQDEIETAERARTILESGVPSVIDSQGKPSVNLGGIELDHGDLHRYSPWAQFYTGAVGLGVGRWMGFSPDASVRFPFVMAHGATAGLISYGLVALASVPTPVAMTLSIFYALQTERVTQNRTARYHALLDFFLVLGLLGIGGIRKNKSLLGYGLPLSIFFLPQSHSLGGSAASLLLGLQGTLIFWNQKNSTSIFLKNVLLFIAIPGILSLGLLLVLTQPWSLEGLGEFQSLSLWRTYKIRKRMLYAFYFFIGSILICWVLKEKFISKSLILTLMTLIVVSILLDGHSYSQYRYYLFIPLLLLFWPLAFGWGALSQKAQWGILGLMALFLLIPEFTTRRFKPYQGLKIISHDFQMARQNQKQPLHEAIDIIKSNSKKGDPVLFNYAPQFVNWYLPDHDLALVPDPGFKTNRNKKNPIWNKPLKMPAWHLWYPNMSDTFPSHFFDATFHVEEMDEVKGRYVLISEATGKSVLMCIQKSWKTFKWNNAPASLFYEASFSPQGPEEDTMVLARPCPAEIP